MSKTVKATIGLMIATILCKILGFAREIVLASAYGASAYSDAYLVALNIPTVILAGVGTALTTVFIPLYYEVENESDKNEIKKFSNNILNIILIISIVMAIISIVFARPIVNLFAVGFKNETLDIAVYFTRVLMIGIVFIALSNVLTSLLQVKNNFIIPGLVSMPYNIVIIISIVLSKKFNSNILIWGTLLALLTQFLIQLPWVYKEGFKYKLYINLKDTYLKKMIKLILPIFVGVFAAQFNTLIDRTLASTLQEGSISALNYANKLNGFIVAIFISSISVVIYPKLSKLSYEDDKSDFKGILSQSINSIILLILPITVGAIVLSKPIVQVLFERGAFNSEATEKTAIALVFYTIGLIGIGVKDIFRRVFYAMKDTKTPMINGIIAIIINISLNFILINFMGHAGLALATSISAIATTIMLYISLKIKIHDFGQNEIFKTSIKSLIASIIMGIEVLYVYKLIRNLLEIEKIEILIALFISILIGAFSYLLMMIVLKVKEIDIILESLKKNKNKEFI